MLDQTEYGRWLDAAQDSLAVARHSAAGGFYAAAVLHAEQAAQCALKAVLHGVGANDRARGDSLPALADAAREQAGLVIDDANRTALAELAVQYQPTRYPDALPAGTPKDYYGPRQASDAIGVAGELTGVVTRRWARLLATAEGTGR